MEDDNDDDDDFNVSVGDDEFGINNSTFVSTQSVKSHDDSFGVDEGELSEGGGLPTSTPTKSSGFKKPTTPSGRSRKAKPPPEEYFARCSTCGSYLKTARGYNNHLKNHRWKVAAARVPPVAETIDLCKEKFPEILDKLVAEFDVPAEVPGHFQSQKYVCSLKEMKTVIAGDKGEKFAMCIMEVFKVPLSSPDGKKALPSALRPLLQTGVMRMFSDMDYRKKLWEAFSELTKCDEEVGWNILFPLAKRLCDTAFIIICKAMRGNLRVPVARTRSKDDFNHILCQQNVHHVCGAALRSHFRASFSHPKNAQIQNIKKCILSKFARIGTPPVVSEKSPQYWTSLINRKSLFFLHDSALPFFIELAKLLQSLENSSGSLGHDRVMKALVDHPTLLLLWDTIVDNFLSEDESFRFMGKLVKSITNTYASGILKRRMNARVKSGKGNKTQLAIGHRARLIGKVTQCPSTTTSSV